MHYGEFLTHLIEDGIEAARFDYGRRPDQSQMRSGAIKGFEECRDRTPSQLSSLLTESRQITQDKLWAQAPDYWYWRCRAAEIEWVCNVVSAMLHNQRQPIIIQPTVRGIIKAAEIVGIAPKPLSFGPPHSG